MKLPLLTTFAALLITMHASAQWTYTSGNAFLYNTGNPTQAYIGSTTAGKAYGFLGTSQDANGYFDIHSVSASGSPNTFGNIVLNVGGGQVGIGLSSLASVTISNSILHTFNPGEARLMVLNTSANAYSDAIVIKASSALPSAHSQGILFADANSMQAAIRAKRLDQNTTYLSDLQFYTGDGISDFQTEANVRMTIGHSGFVGIGSTSPVSMLDVSATAASQGIRSVSSAASGISSGGGLLAAASIVPTAAAQRLGTITMGAMYDASSSNYRYPVAVNAFAAEPWSTTANGSYLTFNTTALGTASYLERMRIDAGGNVGIGTITPGTFLDVLAPAANQGIRSINSSALGTFSGGGLLASTPSIPTAAAQRLGTLAMGATYDAANPASYRYTGSVNAFAAEPWSTTANGTYLTFNTTGIGTTSYAEKMRIDPAGNVGIGTSTPSQRLDVYQNEANATDVLYPIVIERNWNGTGGSNTPRITGLLFKDINGIQAGVQAIRENSFLNFKSGIAFMVNSGNSGSMSPTTALNEVMRINSSGFVGIATTSPDQKLTVNGNIHSKAVIVDTNILPDYVFNKNYDLAPLNEVKEYIAKNHHLPDVPSAAQVEKNGLNLGDMNTVLLKKVEELTLYMIDLQKQNTDLKKELIRTKKKNHLK
ncbi:MAG: hypothetical protein JWR50_1414 [Mucilaginibacter sp.]|nr:hypothetical protein [Mucilaginibacter sp.]